MHVKNVLIIRSIAMMRVAGNAAHSAECCYHSDSESVAAHHAIVPPSPITVACALRSPGDRLRLWWVALANLEGGEEHIKYYFDHVLRAFRTEGELAITDRVRILPCRFPSHPDHSPQSGFKF